MQSTDDLGRALNLKYKKARANAQALNNHINTRYYKALAAFAIND